MKKVEPIPQIDWLSAQEVRRLRRTLESLIDELGVDASLQLMSFIVVALTKELDQPLRSRRASRSVTGYSKRLVERVVEAIFSTPDSDDDVGPRDPSSTLLSDSEASAPRLAIVKGAQAFAAVLRAGKESRSQVGGKRPATRKRPLSKTMKGWEIKTRASNGIKFMEFDGKDEKRVRLSLGTRCEKQAEDKATRLFLAYWEPELGQPKQP